MNQMTLTTTLSLPGSHMKGQGFPKGKTAKWHVKEIRIIVIYSIESERESMTKIAMETRGSSRRESYGKL